MARLARRLTANWRRPNRASRPDGWIVGFTALGLSLRVAYGLAEHGPFQGDQIAYHLYGSNFGQWWTSVPDAFRTPGYLLFMWPNYLAGFGNTGVRMAQAVVLSAACLLLASVVGGELGRRAGRITALIAALYPPFIALPAPILSDALAVSLFVMSFCALFRARSSQHPVLWAVATSLLLTATILVRPIYLVTAPIFIVGLLLRADSLRNVGKLALAILVPVVLLFTPWMVRNEHNVNRPAPLGTADTRTLSVAALHLPIDRTGGQYGAWFRSVHYFSTATNAGNGPLDRLEATGRDPWLILRYNLRHRPLEQVSAMAFWMRELILVPFDDRAQYGRPSYLPFKLIWAVHLLILGLALVGIALTWWRPVVWFATAAAVCLAAPFLVQLPEPRYASSIIFLALIPAAAAIDRLIAWKGTQLVGAGREWGRRRRRLAADRP